MNETLPASPALRGRWVQLWLGVLCMALIANLQYAWTLFVKPDPPGPRLEPGGNPMGLQHFHCHRDVADPRRRHHR